MQSTEINITILQAIKGLAAGHVLFLSGVIIWLLTGGLAFFASLPIMMLGSIIILVKLASYESLSRKLKVQLLLAYTLIIAVSFYGLYW